MLGRAEIRHTGAPQFSVDRSFLWTGPAAYKMVGGDSHGRVALRLQFLKEKKKALRLRPQTTRPRR